VDQPHSELNTALIELRIALNYLETEAGKIRRTHSIGIQTQGGWVGFIRALKKAASFLWRANQF
jgi:hypothetical protein